MSSLATLVRMETRLFLRDVATVGFGVLFPAGLLLGLGLVPSLRETSPETLGLRAIDIWAPTALVFGMVMVACQHVPAVVATYRERGILRRMWTTPVHPGKLLLAQMVVAFGSVVVSAVLMIGLGWAVLGVRPPERPLAFVVAFLAGYAALLGIGLLSAALVRTSSAANQVGTLLFVALMFFGGAFLPRMLMPEVLRTAGEFIPPGLQALTTAWSPEAGALTAATQGQPFWLQIAIMVAIALVASTVAARRFRWE